MGTLFAPHPATRSPGATYDTKSPQSPTGPLRPAPLLDGPGRPRPEKPQLPQRPPALDALAQLLAALDVALDALALVAPVDVVAQPDHALHALALLQPADHELTPQHEFPLEQHEPVANLHTVAQQLEPRDDLLPAHLDESPDNGLDFGPLHDDDPYPLEHNPVRRSR